jgi:hypothetical protein
MSLFIEETLLKSVREMLAGPVCELLAETELNVLALEDVCPSVKLVQCERSEKERLIRLDAYALTVSLFVPDGEEAERLAYGYAWAVDTALSDDQTLGGVVEHAVITGKKYDPPKYPHCGDGWQVMLSLHITVAGTL